MKRDILPIATLLRFAFVVLITLVLTSVVSLAQGDNHNNNNGNNNKGNGPSWQDHQDFSLVELEKLNFGSVIAGMGSGTVTVSPNSIRTISGGLIPYDISTQQISAALIALDLQGNHGAGRQNGHDDEYKLNFPTSVTLKNKTGGTMQITNFTHSPLVKVGSTQQCSIGATLHINADQQPGEYSGEINIDTSYD